MIFIQVKIPLDQGEWEALKTASETELRSPIDQVRFILRAELSRQGLLPAESQKTDNTRGANEQLSRR